MPRSTAIHGEDTNALPRLISPNHIGLTPRDFAPAAGKIREDTEIYSTRLLGSTTAVSSRSDVYSGGTMPLDDLCGNPGDETRNSGRAREQKHPAALGNTANSSYMTSSG
ncbi:hypothetical protein EIP86_009360 [Pleurotus ostreatoroseus]|nr:hypothetical protein EIP86_009360 [Pleurotus ostreatoroseus]